VKPRKPTCKNRAKKAKAFARGRHRRSDKGSVVCVLFGTLLFYRTQPSGATSRLVFHIRAGLYAP
jgi:hypothetical protein